MTTRLLAYRIVAFGVLAITVICCAFVFLVQPPPTVHNVDVVHLRTSIALAVTITSLGGAVLFIGGARSFKTQLRVAYNLLAAGIILFGLALLQLPIAGFFDLWDTWWANSGIIILPFVFATSLIYLGVRQFARLLQITHILASVRFVAAVATIGTALGFAGGHFIALGRDIPGTDIYIAIITWSAVCCTCAALLAGAIRQRIGPFYHGAMRWLFAALCMLALGGWHEFTINFFMNNDTWYVSYGLSFIPFVLSGLAILRAGYAFALLGLRGAVQQAGEGTAHDYIANISSIGDIAALKEEVNPILEGLSEVAAEAAPGQKLTDSSKDKLISAYLGLETYLMHDDPMRSFKRDELRDRLRPAFREALEQQIAEQNANQRGAMSYVPR